MFLKKDVHSLWFQEKHCKTVTSDRFLNFWVFPAVTFLNPTAPFLKFSNKIHKKENSENFGKNFGKIQKISENFRKYWKNSEKISKFCLGVS